MTTDILNSMSNDKYVMCYLQTETQKKVFSKVKTSSEYIRRVLLLQKKNLLALMTLFFIEQKEQL